MSDMKPNRISVSDDHRYMAIRDTGGCGCYCYRCLYGIHCYSEVCSPSTVRRVAN